MRAPDDFDPIDSPLTTNQPVRQEPLPGVESEDEDDDAELDDADRLTNLPIPDNDEDE